MELITKEMLNAFCQRKAREMEAFIQREIAPNFKLDVVRMRYRRTAKGMSFGGRRFASGKGIVSFMNLNVSNWVGRPVDHKTNFTEYKHIADRADIGNSYNIGWQEYLTILIAHEIAHALEYSLGVDKNEIVASANSAGFVAADPRTFKVKGHGLLWQWIYKQVRDEFFNQYVCKGFPTETVKVRAKRKNNMTFRTTKRGNTTYYLDPNDNSQLFAVVRKFYRTTEILYSSKGMIKIIDGMTLDREILDQREYVNDGRAARKRVHEIFKGE